MTDYFEIIIIELPKVVKAYHKTPNDEVLQWMLFLDNPEKEEVSRIMEENKDIKEAKEELDRISQDDLLRRRVLNRTLEIADKLQMKKELEENPEKYANTPLVKVAYGDDDPTKSTSETQALLTDSSIKVIIAPTTVGMLAAGKVLQDKQSDVKLTGLGLPSEMAPFIEDGTCPWMYLWNPVDIGYLSGYTMDALVKGTITGDVGGSFNAGDLGEKKITEAADGGTEVMLGDPFKFDTENIAEWKEVY